MKILLLADVHGNKEALTEVLDDVNNKYKIDGLLLLGDLIDYGMNSNIVVEMIRELPYHVIGNIWGNHEQAIVNECFDRFSSRRGQECAKYTRKHLDENTWNYLDNNMMKEGIYSFELCGKKCLAVHGSMEDYFWISIEPKQVDKRYQQYDYVFSGHSHMPHMFEMYFEVNNEKMRNKKKTIFINPGSVGQPRNHNSRAQYAVVDVETEEVLFEKVSYDIAKEQSCFTEDIDAFYKYRLGLGI